MGYTHYWYRPKEIEPITFVKIKMDFERVLPALTEAGIKLGNGYGLGFPIMNGEMILFNGPGSQGYEGMNFPRILTLHPDDQPNEQGHHFEFCKTDQRPYDLAVTAFLLIAKHHLQDDLIIRSDKGHSNWEAAQKLCEPILNYDVA
ncbi:hypothetical protein [Paenibacillus hunanensis]|uniref:Uncharacterized protein n=1 Tax=Paenibacillus hunanensis TaxID=539262 RepID=A0ABU1IW52_9BACL|nr:hypothetical protein [Paenibacillus hunanensis]MDR6243491.1 hypothetical protein [Paenibacillus hunanensis]GGI98142.1 hypothetical protein GCM10008022_03530 [Paenibacillus hunanensis]